MPGALHRGWIDGPCQSHPASYRCGALVVTSLTGRSSEPPRGAIVPHGRAGTMDIATNAKRQVADAAARAFPRHAVERLKADLGQFSVNCACRLLCEQISDSAIGL